MAAPCQRLQDTRHWSDSVHDTSVVTEGLLDYLLQPPDVSSPSSPCDGLQIDLTCVCSEGVSSAKRVAYWGAYIMPITYVSCLLVAFLKCIPFEKQWQIDPEPQSM